MMILCVAEIRHGKLVSSIFELLTAAKAMGQPVAAAVVGGAAASAAADTLKGRGFEKVYVASHASLDGQSDEAYAHALKAIVAQAKPETVLLPASAQWRAVAPRLAVLLGTGLASDVIEATAGADKKVQVVRAAFGGNVLSKIAVKGSPAIVTVRPMSYTRTDASGSGAVENVAIAPAGWKVKTRVTGFAPEAATEVDLAAAEKVVSGGRGLGNPQGFELIRKLAQTLGAAVGASRATVDAGWIPYRHQVGLTGRTVRPRLYVACGISGQIQHLAGMSASDVIVAINTDKDCPMMKLANFAVHGDLNEIIPAIVAEVHKLRGEAPAMAGAKKAYCRASFSRNSAASAAAMPARASAVRMWRASCSARSRATPPTGRSTRSTSSST
ncbi:MAG: electron transfer flavoprotein subunit alpha/FixB family protein [Elusimicrobia bacterium]|nr:electron transfer flavoprotein subunit alpha/FixB family protein [Elusimicrobiota bacterium]